MDQEWVRLAPHLLPRGAEVIEANMHTKSRLRLKSVVFLLYGIVAVSCVPWPAPPRGSEQVAEPHPNDESSPRAHAAGADRAMPAAKRAPDVPYEPSEPTVVSAMLRLGEVGANDIVYDLGCGDGRIVIAAVKERGARGVCVDIDAQRIRESRENARRAGVADRIEFREQDLFETQIESATVVMLFLWPEVNLRLIPKLKRELKSGTRIVSHWHDMGPWKPERVEVVKVGNDARPVYRWTMSVDAGH